MFQSLRLSSLSGNYPVIDLTAIQRHDAPMIPSDQAVDSFSPRRAVPMDACRLRYAQMHVVLSGAGLECLNVSSSSCQAAEPRGSEAYVGKTNRKVSHKI